MWKLKSYLLPANDYLGISFDEALELGDLVELICEKDELFIPNEFYNILDKNGISASDYLFNPNMNDISQYLFDVITKQKSSSDEYNRLIEDILKVQGSFLKLVNKIAVDGIDNYLIESKKDIIKLKRFYISYVDNYDEFKNRAIDCYPNLVFHPDAFLNIHKLGDIKDVNSELMRHLELLSDKGKLLYLKNGTNEKMTLDNLKSEFKINCSGKGSNEDFDYNKKMKYPQSGSAEEFEYNLTCNPHTKFFNGNNNQRIYFCWGRKEIRNHDIIIARIGDHWK